jgi:MFS family permease
VQVAGTLLSGTLMDLYGTRGLFILNFASSAVNYLMYYLAPNAWWLYAAQIPTLFQHGMLATRTYLSVAAKDDATREQLVSWTRGAYGVGMLVGPVLGGWLADSVDVRTPALIAAVGSVLSCLTVVLLDDGTTPGSGPPTKAKDGAETTPKGAAGDAKPASEPVTLALIWSSMQRSSTEILASPVLRSVFIIRGLGQLAGSLAYRAIPIAAKSTFGMEATGLGALISVAAGVGTVAQVGTLAVLPAIRAAAGRSKSDGSAKPVWAITDTQILLLGTSIVAAGMAMLAYASTVTMLYAAILVMSVGPVGVDVILTGRVASLAKDKGFANSADMAIGTVLRSIIAPTLSAAIIASFGFQGIGLVSAGMTVVVLLLVVAGVVEIDAKPTPGGETGTKAKAA